jgi:shikimate 5-dehydrogenase
MNLSDAVNEQTRQKLFVSLAGKPGTTGTTFYNKLFDYHNIDAEYVACSCVDLAQDIDLARNTCSGISVTMPFKSTNTSTTGSASPGPLILLKLSKAYY